MDKIINGVTIRQHGQGAYVKTVARKGNSVVTYFHRSKRIITVTDDCDYESLNQSLHELFKEIRKMEQQKVVIDVSNESR